MENFLEKMAEKAMGQGQNQGYQGGPPDGYPRPQEGYGGGQPGYGGRPEFGGQSQGGFMGQPGYGEPGMPHHGQPQGFGGPGGPMEGHGMGGPGGGYSGGYGGGGGGGGYGGHEGLDWSHLGRLAQHYDGQPVPGEGGPPPPSDANPNIINKLLGHFQNNTGSSFHGGGDQFEQLAAMASKLTGFPVPASILRKLIGAKLGGML